jgi:thymidylate kinase
LTQKSCLICFTGVDGSGKTTNAKHVANYLAQKHYSCSYVRGASRPILSYSFFALARVLGYWRYTKKNAYTDPLEFAPPSALQGLGVVWRFLLFIDYQIKTTVRIRWPLLLGRVVVCDRYFYDMLMELELSKVNSAKFTSLLSESLPKPVVTFLMVMSDALATGRRDFPQDFFSKRNKVLMDLSRVFNFVVIDSSRTIEENQEIIREVIARRMRDAKEQR